MVSAPAATDNSDPQCTNKTQNTFHTANTKHSYQDHTSATHEPMDTMESDTGENEDIVSNSCANVQFTPVENSTTQQPVDALVLQNPLVDSKSHDARHLATDTSTYHDTDTVDMYGSTLEQAGERIITMTGTLKRAKRSSTLPRPNSTAPEDDMVEVQIRLSEAELMRINQTSTRTPRLLRDASHEGGNNKVLSFNKGPHVLIWSMMCIPVVFSLSLLVAFYYGALTWYNVYLYVTEETAIWKRVLLAPVLVLLFPFMIVTSTLGLATYAALVQLSWNLPRWYKEVQDVEKGFHGWLCDMIRLPECSPFQVVILQDEDLFECHSSPTDGLNATAESAL